ALVWLVTGGRASLVPWALILVNLAAGIGLAFAAAGLARASGRHAAWGVPLALLPGVAVALSRDTGELVAVACLAAGLLALRHHRFLFAAIGLSAAVLARETTIAVPLGIVLASALGGMRAQKPALRRCFPVA